MTYYPVDYAAAAAAIGPSSRASSVMSKAGGLGFEVYTWGGEGGLRAAESKLR